MSGMSPERLAEIRANLPDPSADLSRRERDSHALLAHVDHLTTELEAVNNALDDVTTERDDALTDGLHDHEQAKSLTAENARLRAGIADARMYCSRSTFCLTIPPTEGETDRADA